MEYRHFAPPRDADAEPTPRSRPQSRSSTQRSHSHLWSQRTAPSPSPPFFQPPIHWSQRAWPSLWTRPATTKEKSHEAFPLHNLTDASLSLPNSDRPRRKKNASVFVGNADPASRQRSSITGPGSRSNTSSSSTSTSTTSIGSGGAHPYRQLAASSLETHLSAKAYAHSDRSLVTSRDSLHRPSTAHVPLFPVLPYSRPLTSPHQQQQQLQEQQLQQQQQQPSQASLSSPSSAPLSSFLLRQPTVHIPIQSPVLAVGSSPAFPFAPVTQQLPSRLSRAALAEGAARLIVARLLLDPDDGGDGDVEAAKMRRRARVQRAQVAAGLALTSADDVKRLARGQIHHSHSHSNSSSHGRDRNNGDEDGGSGSSGAVYADDGYRYGNGGDDDGRGVPVTGRRGQNVNDTPRLGRSATSSRLNTPMTSPRHQQHQHHHHRDQSKPYSSPKKFIVNLETVGKQKLSAANTQLRGSQSHALDGDNEDEDDDGDDGDDYGEVAAGGGNDDKRGRRNVPLSVTVPGSSRGPHSLPLARHHPPPLWSYASENMGPTDPDSVFSSPFFT